MPVSLFRRVWGVAFWQWIGLAVGVVLAYAIGRSLTFVLTRIFQPITDKTEVPWDDQLLRALRRPSRFMFGVLAFYLLLEPLALAAPAMHVISRLLGSIAIGAGAWIAVGVTGVLSGIAESRARDAGPDRSEADVRAVKTRVRVLRRVINVAVCIVALALILTQFELVRNLGVSLLASAGVAGVAVGFAAQRTFGSLIAGIQLSFTQPIRIGDVVIVEGEWGTIEEVTLTFVVVRIWDERRLIIPITRFLEQPFENWTKVSPELHGTIFLYADWSLPVDEMRAELDRLLDGNPHWDQRTKTVAVTATSDRALEVRVLVSARDAGSLWQLRVYLRERLVAWLQGYEGGKYLPRVRVLGSPDGAGQPREASGMR